MSVFQSSITYNGKDLTLGDTQATPFVSQENEYVQVGGGTWVILKKITLSGTLVACGQGPLILAINQLRAIFDEDYHSLNIQDVATISCIKVLSMDFGPSQLLSHIDYTISLQAYDQASFKDTHKVVEPSERVEFTESDNKSMQKVITVSAKGVNSGSNDALANAKAFVEAQFSKREKNKPALIASADQHQTAGHLSTVAEQIDRIKGTYSLSKTFISDLGFEQRTTSPGDVEPNELASNFDAAILLRYSKELGDQKGEYSVISYVGTVNYGIDNESASPKAHSKLNAFIKEVREIGYRVIGLEVNEDVAAGVINFNFQYTEDNVETLDDWEVTVSEGSSSSLIKVSVHGIVTAKGPKDCRWDQVTEYFGTDAEAKERYFGIAATHYDDYGVATYQHAVKKDVDGGLIVLNKICTDFQISRDENNGEIAYTFNFDNRLSRGYHSFDYSINISPSIWRIASAPAVNGNWVMIDLGYRGRARFDIHGQFVAGDGATALVPANLAKEKYLQYCGTPAKEWYELEESTVLKGGSQKVGDNFAYGWSFLAPEGATKGRTSTSIIAGGGGAGDYVTPSIGGLIISQGMQK